MRLKLAALLLATTALSVPVEAKADPVSLVTIIASSAFGAATWTTAGIAAFSWSAFAVNASLGLASLALGEAMQKKPAVAKMASRTQNIREPVSPRVEIYGRQKVGGKLIFAETTNGNDKAIFPDLDNDTKHLHLVFAVAGHEIEGFETFYVGNRRVTLGANGFPESGPYRRHIRIRYKTGTADQTAFSELVAESDGKWTNAHRGRGVALVYARLRRGAEVWKSGIPNISCVVRGRKVRNLITNTVEYSTNAVWCIADKIGQLGGDLSALDLANWKGQGAIADENVAKKPSGTRKRYTCNGTLQADETPKSQLEAMLTATAGTLVWTGGKWQIAVGAYRPPAATFTLDDVRGPIKIISRNKIRDTTNAVKGAFVGPETDWTSDSYPAIRSDYFKQVDGGIERVAELDLPFTQTASEAQTIAQIALYRAREQVTIETTLGLRALLVTVGDTCRFVSERHGFTAAQAWEVTRWRFVRSVGDDGAMQIEVTLRQTSAAVFQANPDEKVFERNNTTLPDPFDAEKPTMSVMSEMRQFNESVMCVLQVQLTGGDGVEYQVEYKPSNVTAWRGVGRSSTNVFEVPGVSNQNYDIRARSRNVFGNWSDWVTKSNYRPSAFSEPPGDVQDFDAIVTGNNIHLSWWPVSDQDLSHYIIKHSPLLAGATWNTSSTVGKKVARPATSVTVPYRSGSYLIKAVDKFGNYSVNASVVTTNVGDILNMNVIQTITDSPTFSGSKTNTILSSVLPVGLVLTSAITDTTGVGYYYPPGSVDLGDVYTSRVKVRVEFERFEYGSRLFDSVPGLFDAQPGFFQNADVSDLDVDVYYAVRNSTADSWSQWFTLTNAEVTGRYLKFRVALRSTTAKASPKVTSLQFVIDMPDRLASGTGITSNAAGTAITFSPAFRQLAGIAITAEDMNTGDYYRITSKSVSGFTIRFYNSAGTGISRVFDWVARGVGAKV